MKDIPWTINLVSTFVLLDRNVNALTLTWFIWFICFNLSPLKLWVRIPLRRGVLDTTLCDKVCQWLAAGRWFSPCTLVSSNNKTDLHDVTEILLKVALNTINLYVSNFTFPQYCNVNLPHAFYFGFQSFEYEIKKGTWWRLFQKLIVRAYSELQNSGPPWN